MKKLTIALLAFLTVGAAAEQNRYYTGDQTVIRTGSAGRYVTTTPGYVTTTPVEAVRVRVAPGTSRVFLTPGTMTSNGVTTPVLIRQRIVVVPADATAAERAALLNETADVELLRDHDYDAYDGRGNYNSDLDRMRYDTRPYRYND